MMKGPDPDADWCHEHAPQQDTGIMREYRLYDIRRNPEGRVQWNHRFAEWLQELPGSDFRENFNALSYPPVLPTRPELRVRTPQPFHPVRDSKLVTDVEYLEYMKSPQSISVVQFKEESGTLVQDTHSPAHKVPRPNWPARQSIIFPSAFATRPETGLSQRKKHRLDDVSLHYSCHAVCFLNDVLKEGFS